MSVLILEDLTKRENPPSTLCPVDFFWLCPGQAGSPQEDGGETSSCATSGPSRRKCLSLRVTSVCA